MGTVPYRLSRREGVRAAPGSRPAGLTLADVAGGTPYVWRDRDAEREAEVAAELAAIREQAAARAAKPRRA